MLLIAAIGIGIYFYFSKKQETSTLNSKELIVGKWKVDSLTFKKDTSVVGRLFSRLFDSSLGKYEFEFSKDGSIFETYDGSIKDTSHYTFADNSTLLISNDSDTAKDRWSISKLDSSVMRTRDKDSTMIYFSRTTQ